MADPTRQRLRFDGLEYDVFPDGSCRVEVRLEWGGEIHTAEARGMQPLDGSLRTAAHATLDAAVSAAGHSLSLTLLGVKAIRAFDSILVVAAVQATDGGSSFKLLGTEDTGSGRPVEAAVRAVLDALNRVLERYVVGSPDSPEG